MNNNLKKRNQLHKFVVYAVVGCGWLWLVVVDCGQLWLVVVGCGWLVVVGCGGL